MYLKANFGYISNDILKRPWDYNSKLGFPNQLGIAHFNSIYNKAFQLLSQKHQKMIFSTRNSLLFKSHKKLFLLKKIRNFFISLRLIKMKRKPLRMKKNPFLLRIYLLIQWCCCSMQRNLLNSTQSHQESLKMKLYISQTYLVNLILTVVEYKNYY